MSKFVMVPLEEIEAACARFAKAQIFDFSRRMRSLLEHPSEQHQGEPVAHALAEKVREVLDRQACPNAWMVIAYEAVVQNYTHADTDSLQRAWQAGYDTAWYAKNPAEKRTSVNPVDAGEVERLRELVKAYMNAEAEKGIELVKLRAQLAELEIKYCEELSDNVKRTVRLAERYRSQLAERDALLQELALEVREHAGCYSVDHEEHWRIHALADKAQALSASAAPSAPVERDERAEFDAWHQRIWPGESPALRSWQVWNGRAALERKP